MPMLSINTIRDIYQRHVNKCYLPRSEALGHASALLVLNGHCSDLTQSRRYVKAMFA